MVLQTERKIETKSFSSLKNNDVARAAFIVGALVLEGIIEIDLTDIDGVANWNWSVKAVTQLLMMSEPDEGNPGNAAHLHVLKGDMEITHDNDT